jgi:hypothetical protein
MMTLPKVPSHPLATNYRPEAYRAFSALISNPDVYGIGANVRDLEILRIACLEKVRRDGPRAKFRRGFKLNFLANIWADWAEDRVLFWDEGLGRQWNLLVNDECPALLLTRTLHLGTCQNTFAFFKIPARLPGADCEIHDDYTICRRNELAPPLTEEEKALWDAEGKAFYGNQPSCSFWSFEREVCA